MSLAQAVQGHAKTLADTQSTYQTDVVAVNTYVTSVLTSKLPQLNQVPPDFPAYTAAYEQATAGALNWVNTVLARLLDVPDEVVGYNSIISGLLQDAAAQATTLQSNPSNATALATLDQDLAALSRQLGLVVTFISGAVTAIQTFQDDLPGMATSLQTIATKSANDAKVDQGQIDTLLADISRLQNDIKSLTAAIIGLGIADAAAITLGVVATIALWPVGALTWLVLGPAVAVATTYIALDAKQIVADKAAIKADQDNITGLAADVATLQVLAQNFTTLANQTAEIETTVTSILAEWQALESEVNTAIADIRTAVSDTSGSNFAAVAADLHDAVTEWNQAYAQAGTLHLDLQVNNAELTYGMSSSQVSAALATGQVTDVITYFNQVGTTS